MEESAVKIIAQFELINDTKARPEQSRLHSWLQQVSQRLSVCATVSRIAGIRSMRRATRAAIHSAQQPEMKKNSSQIGRKEGEGRRKGRSNSNSMYGRKHTELTRRQHKQSGWVALIDGKLWVKNLNCPRHTSRLRLICSRAVEGMTF